MAWATKKQFAILNNSDKGKKIAKNLPNLSQDDFQRQFTELIKGSKSDKEVDIDEDKQKETIEKKTKPEETPRQEKNQLQLVTTRPSTKESKLGESEGKIDKKALKSVIDDMIAKFQSQTNTDENTKIESNGAVKGLKQLSNRLGLGAIQTSKKGA